MSKGVICERLIGLSLGGSGGHKVIIRALFQQS